MAIKLTYKILRSVGEETPQGNVAFDQLEQFVNEHIRDDWRPVGGITVSSVVGPRRFDKRQLVRARGASDGTRN